MRNKQTVRIQAGSGSKYELTKDPGLLWQWGLCEETDSIRKVGSQPERSLYTIDPIPQRLPSRFSQVSAGICKC